MLNARRAVFAALLAVLAAPGLRASPKRPNVLIVIADDCTCADLPDYGGTNIRTPAISRLAREGPLFERAYASTAMCQPCRAELYTDLFPLRNGCAWNRAPSRPGVRSLPHHPGVLGYRVGLAGKVHVAPRSVFPFEEVAGWESNCTREPTRPHDLGHAQAFMTRDAPQPFCLVVALVVPHVPWVMGGASTLRPAQRRLPPTLADTPTTREDYARYLVEIAYMDAQAGALLDLLDEAGLAASTLTIFISEQGSQFPGHMRTCREAGARTASIVRWPDRVPAGRRTRALVQYVDVLPTLVELAGGDPEAARPPLDGRSFAAVLRGERDAHRNFAYGLHHNVPEGPPYPIPTVTDGEWRYVRNLTPERLSIEKHTMGLLGGSAPHNAYWPSWMAHSRNRPEVLHLVERHMRRPAEELYHVAGDPWNLDNRAGDPCCAAIHARLAAELDRWMATQRDPGAAMDRLEVLQEVRRAGRDPEHRR